MKHLRKTNARLDARVKSFDSIKDMKKLRGMKRPGSRKKVN